MALSQNKSHKVMVNRLFTFLAIALLPLPALAAGLDMPVSVAVLSPTAHVESERADLILHGQSGQIIYYSAGQRANMVTLDTSGQARIKLPKRLAANAEIIFSYD
jgi:glucose/arabinose dehydrogenase